MKSVALLHHLFWGELTDLTKRPTIQLTFRFLLLQRMFIGKWVCWYEFRICDFPGCLDMDIILSIEFLLDGNPFQKFEKEEF